MAKSPFNEIDLIVVDYNLGGDEEHGEAFVEKIRQHDCWTEVVFYSAAQSSELWDAVRSRELEGVFITNHHGVSAKVEKVAYQAVRKVLDLNMMRGMVMAEVGDLDLLLGAIVEKAFDSSDQGEGHVRPFGGHLDLGYRIPSLHSSTSAETGTA